MTVSTVDTSPLAKWDRKRAAVDRWQAFLLSLFVPGTGQLAIGHWACLVWFVVAGLGVATVFLMQPLLGLTGATMMRVAVLLIVGILSAEHAKRLVEPGSALRPAPWPTTPGNRLQVACAEGKRRRIHVEFTVTVNRSPEEMWRRVSDLPRFLCIDPFHERVVVMRRRAAAGVDVAFYHNAFGRRFWRYGRILNWCEGQGYAFSDLSARHRQRGFPHVFFVRLEPVERKDSGYPTSRITITVRGKWTSRWMPAWLGRCWVRQVCHEHGRLLKKAL